MSLRIELHDDGLTAVLIRTLTLGSIPWGKVKGTLLHFEPDADLGSDRVSVPWVAFLAAAPEIQSLRVSNGFGIEYDEAARAQLTRFAVERANWFRADANELTDDQINRRLDAAAFTRRVRQGQERLTLEQGRNLASLVRLSHGANFSVPGAGKTTVAMALHTILRTADQILLVVAPKNALVAWDEVVTESFDPEDPGADTTPFVRLSGSVDTFRRLLTAAAVPKRLIVSYDQLINDEKLRFVAALMRRFPVHLILDESHRIKAGESSLRGQAALNISPFAVRRDILSGTPAPNSIDDIGPQFDFLYPGQLVGTRAIQAENPRAEIVNLYVRTTKEQLGLGPVRLDYAQVSMSDPQLALYGLVCEELLREEARVREDPGADLSRAARSVMSLLQISTYPVLFVRSRAERAVVGPAGTDPTIAAVFQEVMREGESPKMALAVQLAREAIARGERVVIWSMFRESVERLAQLLADTGATFIHGGVDTGSIRDPATREGRVASFHDPRGHCMVLVANPAACGEGISLHRVCHRAIYVDRSFNAAHFLQSVDRIHRLGVPPDVLTQVTILESRTPAGITAIDGAVRARLIVKYRMMNSLLNDRGIQQLLLDEESMDVPVDWGIRREDILAVIDRIKDPAALLGEEMV